MASFAAGHFQLKAFLKEMEFSKDRYHTKTAQEQEART
jgi:hypothetical protein